MRIFFNFLAVVALGISLVTGFFDIVRSVALSRFTMTTILHGLQKYAPEFLADFSRFIRTVFPSGFWGHWVVPVLNIPGMAPLLILSLLFFALSKFWCQN